MTDRPVVVDDLRGGRNGTDPPMSLPPNQCVDAVNVDWIDTTFAHKRYGSSSVSTTGGTAFGQLIGSLIRYVPNGLDADAELWGVDLNFLVKRLPTGTTSWADVTMDDAIATRAYDVTGVTLNGKLFLFYDSAVDRAHVYDPSLASPRVRRMGLQAPTAAPTVANNGAGAYAANPRYYRVRWTQLNGSVTVRKSEAGAASTLFTPSGAGASARVTRPTAPGEGETHWQVEMSTDAGTWYSLASVAIATTTYDDVFDPDAWKLSAAISDAAGAYALPPSAKYAVSDGNRLLMAGAWETGVRTSRVWFTPVLGSSDAGDDERVPNQTVQKNWFDLNENDGGAITALAGPLNGMIYAFKRNQIYRIRPTGDVAAPYLPRKIRDDIGCIAAKSIAIGDDHLGQAAIYFLSHKGPYRITSDGAIQYIGRDNEDYWRAINLGATVIAHSVYYPTLHQWWVWIAPSGQSTPYVRFTFDTQLGMPDGVGQIRGGWSRNDGQQALALCSAMYTASISARTTDNVPHFGSSQSVGVLLRSNSSSTDDNGTTFQAYVTTRPVTVSRDLLHKVGIGEPVVVTKSTTGSIGLSLVRDFGVETRTFTVDMLATGSATRGVTKSEARLGEANVVQVTIGDTAATAQAWTAEAVVIPVVGQERR